MDYATVRFNVDAGLVVRGQLKGLVLARAQQLGLTITVEEVKGLFHSKYFFEADGNVFDILEFADYIKRLSKALED